MATALSAALGTAKVVTGAVVKTKKINPNLLHVRTQALDRLRASIFQTSYNPTGIRTGAKYLRARLRGPSMAEYYPPEVDLAKIAREYPELEILNDAEQQRLQDVSDRKARGKGTPKKAKNKGETRRAQRKR
ncbi:mitochondrial ribosomal subunit S27-domain-containing protein [Schizophyllum amplum]|uniref:Small ribosomal subunit protein mS33 n=1 Tax=Schizophyllum amplum TaxID=97359 RepID=A0A550CYD7_9AGAR|nr:mitochondrial ribosomal subunit S27-domain-containing protein [Auriculariopsis ampla]